MTHEPWRRCLAELRQCASAGGRAALGGFSIEGLRLVERALRAGARLEYVVASERLANSTKARECALMAELEAAPEVELLIAPEAVLEQWLEGRTYGALVGFVRSQGTPTLDSLFEVEGGGTLLVAVDVEDPGNVGALLRTAFAAGARGLAAVGCTDPLHPKAVRTSMGSVFRLPCVHYAEATSALAALREAGVQTIGAVSQAGVSLPALEPRSERLAVVLGSEAFGLSQQLSCQLDLCTTIPMRDGVDSYSINAAAAILLYELGLRRSR